MFGMAADTTSTEAGWRPRRDTARVRDLILAVAAFAVLLGLFISHDFVELLFEASREHEHYELDEILASIPALVLVMAWYAFRRWQEARQLNIELQKARHALEVTHERRLAAEAQLRDAQRMEALGRLAGGLAHELNNMLQPAITLTQLTLKKDGLQPDVRANLEQILAASEHGRDIVGKALTFAGGAGLQQEEVELAPCLKEVVDLARTVLPATVRLELRIAADGETALINRTELTQVISNLMTNAARAMDDRGVLAISLSVEELSEQDRASHGLPAGRYFKMLVVDDGRGMPEDVRRRLFDPFFTTAEPGEHVGLGLSIVHGIVTAWRGAISVAAASGPGTCFKILIPVAGKSAE